MQAFTVFWSEKKTKHLVRAEVTLAALFFSDGAEPSIAVTWPTLRALEAVRQTVAVLCVRPIVALFTAPPTSCRGAGRDQTST